MGNPKFGSLEVYYTYPSATTKEMELITNIKGVRQFQAGIDTASPITVLVTSSQAGGNPHFVKIQIKLNGVVIDQSDFSTYSTVAPTFAVRIFFFDQFVSVSLNDKWVHSYAFSRVEYDAEGNFASLKWEGVTTTVTGIRNVELGDGREAVYVDYESTTDNAIQSVIQQRPVQVFAHVNRKLTFTYVAEKSTVNAVYVHQYDENISHPPGLSSDGLVYAEDVGVSIDLVTANAVGFITRLYRLSELNTGAERAASTMQRQARERRQMIKVEGRLDPRIELTDVLNVNLTTSSTQRVLNSQVIVEDVSISIRDGDTSMVVSGRKKNA